MFKLNFGVTEDADNRVQQHSRKMSKNVSFMFLESLSYWLVGCFVKR